VPALVDVIAAVERWYEPSWAESWDAVGLVCGDPSVEVRRIVLAVDAVPATVAAAGDAQLLLTHHPLFLTAVHGVPITDPKGALVHRMIRSGLALYVAHSNAEIARPGVSDALAATLGVEDLVALEPASAPGSCGVGRVGCLATQTTLGEFTALVAARLPATVGGVRMAGDPDQPIRRVAVLGGSGSSLVDAARAGGAEVFVTADLKHHHAVEAVTQRAGGPASDAPMALIDASHWATEVPWLHLVAARLRAEFDDTVDVAVSDVVTDPWTAREPSATPAERTRDEATERGQR
jgi:dinuclear metal center YbgI/SA1388 family protein